MPLHPESLSEGAGSLLPGETRPAALWTIDLDVDGATTEIRHERAVVRSRAKLDYAGVQASADADTLPLGERIRVRLVKADPQRRTVAFEAIPRSP